MTKNLMEKPRRTSLPQGTPNQPTFNHPELVDYSLPKLEWTVIGTSLYGSGIQVFYAGVGDDTKRKIVTLDENLEKVEESFFDRPNTPNANPFATVAYFDYGFVEEWLDASKVLYRKKVTIETEYEYEETDEEWFDELGVLKAHRHTIGKVLEGEGDPAVTITRPNNLCREEYWDEGRLKKVVVLDQKTDSKLVKQTWKDGICKSQKVDATRLNEVDPRDLALPVAKPKIYVTPAKEAREEIGDEDKIQKILADFESRRSANGTRKVFIRVEERLHSKVADILTEAGYLVYSWDEMLCVQY